MEFATVASAFLMHVGARHISFEMTDAQKKLMQHPLVKGAVLCAMFFVTMRNIYLAVALTCVYFLMVMVLLNEKHALNIYSRPWLAANGLKKREFPESFISKTNYMENLKFISEYY